jgi:hypothetical protein
LIGIIVMAPPEIVFRPGIGLGLLEMIPKRSEPREGYEGLSSAMPLRCHSQGLWDRSIGRRVTTSAAYHHQ